MPKNLDETPKEPNKSSDTIINCGLVMPIAKMKDYPSHQFSDVKEILIDAIKSIKTHNFNPRLVSDSQGEIDIIHKSIVNNLYSDPIVIVDISGRNGNVMLELGLRLAFDKPVIIIKDDKTDYMFDISMIEHLEYPSDLRHNKIEVFKSLLAERMVQTLQKAEEDESYSPFLKHFQRITVKSIGQTSVEIDEMLEIMNVKLQRIESLLAKKSQSSSEYLASLSDKERLVDFFQNNFTVDSLPRTVDELFYLPEFAEFVDSLSTGSALKIAPSFLESDVTSALNEVRLEKLLAMNS